MNTDALEYAMYTVENRAIPSMIDGLKPAQRFFLYSAIKASNKKTFTKITSIAGRVSEFGYHHGEVSAQDVGKLMASEWNNNLPLIEGEGNFGSRMVQESAAARYVFGRLHDNFHRYYKDIDLSPVHSDPEHVPPRFYVPVIPMVLVNGVSGIATGFKTDILPHCPDWVSRAVKEVLEYGEVKSEPVIKFPNFHGTVERTEEGKYIQKGKIEIDGLTVTITEIPTHFEHTKYVELLDDLQESGFISSWTDQTQGNFRFTLRMKRGSNMEPDNLYKKLKLTSTYTQIINVIGPDGKLKQYDDVKTLIKDFVDYRLSFLPNRIDDNKVKSERSMLVSKSKLEFIQQINDGKIVLKGLTRSQAVDLLKKQFDTDVIPVLLSMRVDQMTSDECKKLEKEFNQATKEHKYWSKTTPEKEYDKDLSEIIND